MAGYVFICYSRVDREFVERLARFLGDNGVECWFDRRIDHGAEWEVEIKQRIEGCTFFLVVMTPEAENSDHVRNEINYARARKKRIIPLLLRGDEFFGLSRLNFADVRGGVMPDPTTVDELRGSGDEEQAAQAVLALDPGPVGLYREAVAFLDGIRAGRFGGVLKVTPSSPPPTGSPVARLTAYARLLTTTRERLAELAGHARATANGWRSGGPSGVGRPLEPPGIRPRWWWWTPLPVLYVLCVGGLCIGGSLWFSHTISASRSDNLLFIGGDALAVVLSTLIGVLMLRYSYRESWASWRRRDQEYREQEAAFASRAAARADADEVEEIARAAQVLADRLGETYLWDRIHLVLPKDA